MTIFAITDITAAGAYCNAISAAAESDQEAEARYLERTTKQRTSFTARVLKSLTSLVIEQRGKLAVQEAAEPTDGKLA